MDGKFIAIVLLIGGALFDYKSESDKKLEERIHFSHQETSIPKAEISPIVKKTTKRKR